jgi:hypothetical protein
MLSTLPCNPRCHSNKLAHKQQAQARINARIKERQSDNQIFPGVSSCFHNPLIHIRYNIYMLKLFGINSVEQDLRKSNGQIFNLS